MGRGVYAGILLSLALPELRVVSRIIILLIYIHQLTFYRLYLAYIRSVFDTDHLVTKYGCRLFSKYVNYFVAHARNDIIPPIPVRHDVTVYENKTWFLIAISTHKANEVMEPKFVFR